MKPSLLFFTVFAFLCTALPVRAGTTPPLLELISVESGLVDDPASRGLGVNFRFHARYSGYVGESPAAADYSIALPGGQTSTGTIDFTPTTYGSYTSVFIRLTYAELMSQPLFTATISNPVNLRLKTTSYSVTLRLMPPSVPYLQREFTVAGGSVAEGNAGTKNLPFTIRINQPITEDITFRYITSGGTATPVADYTPVTGTGTIPAGSRTVTIDVPIKGDAQIEPDETLGLDISEISVPVGRSFNPMNNGDTPGTILNDDALPAAVPAATVVTEGPGTDTVKAWFAVNLATVRGTPLPLRVSTRDGTAKAGSDYRALPPADITIPAGEMRVWVAITVTATPEVETAEQFFLDVEDPATSGIQSAACTIERLSVTAISQTSPNTLSLTFTTGFTQRYYIEEATDPAAQWTLATNALTGTGLPLSTPLPLPSAESRHFYRVRTFTPVPPGTAAASS
ncbi:MAG TPA: Calx-beta domain-containing protein [Verrucomicrobiales bacterium]|nr:Calx-beta domain-containing protein [Verrucomicrobiales bacterium]